MANNVLVSAGTSISIKTGAGSFVKIAGITDFSGLGSGSAAIIDTTDLDSVSKEKQMGTPDEGSFKIDLNYIPTDAGQLALDAARTSRALTAIKVVAGNHEWDFSGFVTTFEKSGGVDKQWTGSATVEISGSVVSGTVAA